MASAKEVQPAVSSPQITAPDQLAPPWGRKRSRTSVASCAAAQWWTIDLSEDPSQEIEEIYINSVNIRL